MEAFDLQRFLLSGETIVWSGQPAQGLLLTRRDAVLVPFSLMWGGFAIFWEWSVLSTRGAPSVMGLFGIPFVIIGLYLIGGRFILDAWLRTRTFYALTDHRILIARAGPWAAFKAVSLQGLAEVTLIEKSRGRGTIRFGPETSLWNGRSQGFTSWTASLDPTPQFLSIDDAGEVFRLVQRQARPNA